MKYIIIISATLFCFQTNAQQLISSYGGNAVMSDYQVSWSLGEPVINTVTNSNTILTQGFLQSRLTVTSVPPIISSFQIKVFPNPTSELLYIYSPNTQDEIHVRLYALNGKILQSEKIREEWNHMNVSGLANATYFLKVFKKDLLLKTFKIIKEN